MAPFSIIEAKVASFYVETIILGLYLVTFGEALSSLFLKGSRWKSLKEVANVMTATVLFLFFNTTLATAMSFTIIWQDFIVASPAATGEIFMKISYWPAVVKLSLLLFQTIIVDALLIYRCWVTYFRSFLVIVPFALLWLGAITCAIFMIVYSSILHGSVLVDTNRIHSIGVAFWALSVALNLITTGLLMWRLWWTPQENVKHSMKSVSGDSNHTVGRILRTIIGSGLLYTVITFITFVTYTVGHNAFHIASSAEVGMAGIALNLIITRTDIGGSLSTNPEGSLPLQIMGPPKSGGTVGNGGHIRFLVSPEMSDSDYTDVVEISEVDQSKTRLG